MQAQDQRFHFPILRAKNLGFTGALGSKAEVRDGKYTGAMLGKLLHGKEKAVAISALAKEKGFNLSECYAYSDSHNDFPLLESVGHPSAINPDAILSLRALAEGWPIHDFRRATESHCDYLSTRNTQKD